MMQCLVFRLTFRRLSLSLPWWFMFRFCQTVTLLLLLLPLLSPPRLIVSVTSQSPAVIIAVSPLADLDLRQLPPCRPLSLCVFLPLSPVIIFCLSLISLLSRLFGCHRILFSARQFLFPQRKIRCEHLLEASEICFFISYRPVSCKPLIKSNKKHVGRISLSFEKMWFSELYLHPHIPPPSHLPPSEAKEEKKTLILFMVSYKFTLCAVSPCPGA